MRRFVVGDIHGANQALEQCLARSKFNFEEDLLISIGDICDGWPETSECFNTLLRIKNRVVIMGNHDFWMLEWALGKEPDPIWLANGGESTVKCYPQGVPESHVKLLSQTKNYFELDNKVFVHAGIDPNEPLDAQRTEILLWDRAFFHAAIAASTKPQPGKLTSFDEVYIGHTPIHKLGKDTPIQCAEVWMIDTGAGWGEKLSIMDIDTKELFQSDRTLEMYPKGSGRV